MRRALRHPAFTLLEVVIAIALLATLIAVLSISIGAMTDSWYRLQTHTQRFESLLVLDRTLDGILANVVAFTWPAEQGDVRGRSVPIFAGADDHLIVAYIHRFNRLEDGAIRFCGLYQEDAELVAYYCDRPPFPEDLRSHRLRRSVLAGDVREVKFLYADIVDDELTFEDQWDDEEKDYLPLAILLQVAWNNGEHENWLRRIAGAGYYERWGVWQQQTEAPQEQPR